MQTLQAGAVTFRDLETHFGLQLVEDATFFSELQTALPEISDEQKQQLDRIKAGYRNLLRFPPMLEGVVRMAILDPLLFVGGFYLEPFHAKAERSIQITAEDEGVKITGSLDVLILKDRLWVMVVESKQLKFSIEAGLAQILAYMLGSRQPVTYGMITTGGSFMFLKVERSNGARYGASRLYSLLNPGNELYEVLQIFMRLTQHV